MKIRKNHRFQWIDIDETWDLSSPENGMMNLQVEEIERMIEDLPMGYRTIFNLYAIEGYSHKEIAEMLQISEGTSKSQLSRARMILQTKFNNSQI